MYYPKSQIKTNQYSNGGDYVLSTTKEAYTGYYYVTSTGKTYTGRTPQDGPNVLLTPPINVTQPTAATNEDPIIYALDAGKEVQIIHQFSQPEDHPIRISFPEGEYLKGLLCRVY